MPVLQPRALPNVITVARIIVAPAIFLLILEPGATARLLAFALFLVAAVSDVWDGYLARKHGWITDFGKLVDPLADKLLLAAGIVPVFWLSHAPNPPGVGPLPYWGAVPLWVLLLVFGREIVVTAMRALAARRGVVVPAGAAGKYKAMLQNLFVGAAILWLGLATVGFDGPVWRAWAAFHGAFLGLSLLAAVAATLYSLVDYARNWRVMARRVS